MLTLLQGGAQIIYTLPAIFYKKHNVLCKKDDRLPLLFHVLLTATLVINAYVVDYLPIREVTGVLTTATLFTLVMARIFLKEPLGKYELLVVATVLAGVVAILDPKSILQYNSSNITWERQIIGCSRSLTVAILLSGWAVVLRKLQDINFTVLVFWSGAGLMLYSLILVKESGGLVFPQTYEQLTIALLCVTTAVAGNLFFTLALHYADASVVMVGKSTELVFVVIYQVVIFRHGMTCLAIGGIILICLAILSQNSKHWIMSQFQNLHKLLKYGKPTPYPVSITPPPYTQNYI